MAPLVEQVLREASTTPSQLTALVVGLGPAGYTLATMPAGNCDGCSRSFTPVNPASRC